MRCDQKKCHVKTQTNSNSRNLVVQKSVQVVRQGAFRDSLRGRISMRGIRVVLTNQVGLIFTTGAFASNNPALLDASVDQNRVLEGRPSTNKNQDLLQINGQNTTIIDHPLYRHRLINSDLAIYFEKKLRLEITCPPQGRLKIITSSSLPPLV